MKDTAKARLWIIVFSLLLLAPVVLLFVAPRPPQREFWREFSVVLGFVGLSLIGLQFLLPARLPFLLRAFRLAKLNHFHHNLSIIGLALIIAHAVILILNNPRLLRSLISIAAARPTWWGIIALLAMIVVVVTSLWKGEVDLGHQPWRVIHTFLSVAAIILALLHIFDVGYYLNIVAHQVIWVALAVLWGVGVIVYFRRANMAHAVDTVVQDLTKRRSGNAQPKKPDEPQT
jgi:predicted ferric reductase